MEGQGNGAEGMRNKQGQVQGKEDLGTCVDWDQRLLRRDWVVSSHSPAIGLKDYKSKGRSTNGPTFIFLLRRLQFLLFPTSLLLQTVLTMIKNEISNSTRRTTRAGTRHGQVTGCGDWE
jgi:hypothetical protein